jgi:hypothetical protein
MLTSASGAQIIRIMPLPCIPFRRELHPTHSGSLEKMEENVGI